MNVASPDIPVSVAASANLTARESNPAAASDSFDAAAGFLGLLTEATAVAPSAAATADAILVAAATNGLLAAASATAGVLTAASGIPASISTTDETDDTGDDESAINWAMPFLVPVQPLVPPVVEAAAPDASGGEEPALVTLTASPDSTPKPLPLAIDAARSSGAQLLAPDLLPTHVPTAPDPVASAVGPRVEVSANGAAHTIVRHIPVPVHDSRWGEHVGHEVRILVERGIQGATLRLTPEHLGPVDVRIDIVNDKANVVFGAAQADTRAALTDAIPRLREMFAGAGLTLGDAGVRQENPSQFNGSGPRHPGQGAFSDGVDDEPAALGRALRTGLIDAYA